MDAIVSPHVRMFGSLGRGARDPCSHLVCRYDQEQSSWLNALVVRTNVQCAHRVQIELLPGGPHHRSIFSKQCRLPCFMLKVSVSFCVDCAIHTHDHTPQPGSSRGCTVHDPHSSVQSYGEREGVGPSRHRGECKGGAGPPFAKTANHVFPGSVFSGAIYWVAAPQFIRNRVLCNTCKCYITFCYVTAKKVLRNTLLRNTYRCYVTLPVT